MRIEIFIRKDMASRPWQIDLNGVMLGLFDTWPAVVAALRTLPSEDDMQQDEKREQPDLSQAEVERVAIELYQQDGMPILAGYDTVEQSWHADRDGVRRRYREQAIAKILKAKAD